MKFNNFTDNDVEVIGENQSLDFSIDTESLGILFKGFSDNLYSNKIGSIVREIASNCFDAHEEIKSTEAVDIRLKEASPFESGHIIFEDYGPGLSPHRIKSIYSRYFASTKRDTDDQIGGFGIGAKSPLAYTSSFNVVTRVDGVEYDYVIHRGSNVPVLHLVTKSSTNKRNGTQVIIPIESSSDCELFKDALKEQLKYFDNIDYSIQDKDFSDDYQIYRGTHWIHRTKRTQEEVEICIGKVAYPLDFYQIFGSTYSAQRWGNFALYFNVGELSVTMNRETIDYNKKTIERIKKKIVDAKEELLALGKKRKITDDLNTYVQLRGDQRSVNIDDNVLLSSSSYFLDDSGDPVYTPFQTPKIQIPADIYKFLEIHKVIGFADRSTSRDIARHPLSSIIFRGNKERGYSGRNLDKVKFIFRLRGALSAKKTAYILQTYGPFIVVRGCKDVDKAYWNSISTDVNLQETYKKHVVGYLLKRSKSYDSVEIPEAWLEANKATINRKTRSKDLLPYKKLVVGYNQNNYDPSFSMESNSVDTLLKASTRYVYGSNSDDLKLKAAYCLLAEVDTRNGRAVLSNFTFIKISKAAYKYFEDSRKCICIDDFVQTHYSLLQRIHAINLAQYSSCNAANIRCAKEAYPLGVLKLISLRNSLGSSAVRAFRDLFEYTYDADTHFVKVGDSYRSVQSLINEFDEFKLTYPLLDQIDPATHVELVKDYLNLKPFNFKFNYYA